MWRAKKGPPISRERPAMSVQLKIFQEKGRTGPEERLDTHDQRKDWSPSWAARA